MEYRNLTTFLRVAELQNFTKAANELGYAQSTVTFHIQSLEEELGVALFDRIGKKVRLTKAGEHLVQYANEMTRIISDMQKLNDATNRMDGTVRVGVVESLLATYMLEAITTYSKRFPDVMIDVVTASSSELAEMLRANEIDLMLMMGNRLVDHDFVRDMIREANASFVAASAHPLAKKKKITFETVAKDRLILMEKNSLYRRTIEEIASHYDCILMPFIQVNHTMTILDLVKKGNGISYLPDYLTRSNVERGTLCVLDVDYELSHNYYIQILHHRSKWVTPQMKEFISLMEELIKER